MELLGLLLVKSLLKPIPKEEVGDKEYGQISEAYLVFFRVIVYWLKFGFELQKRCSV